MTGRAQRVWGQTHMGHVWWGQAVGRGVVVKPWPQPTFFASYRLRIDRHSPLDYQFLT